MAETSGALRFILASFLYQDGIGTIVSFMTLYAVNAVGFRIAPASANLAVTAESFSTTLSNNRRELAVVGRPATS